MANYDENQFPIKFLKNVSTEPTTNNPKRDTTTLRTL